jgi:hypothetical protein
MEIQDLVRKSWEFEANLARKTKTFFPEEEIKSNFNYPPNRFIRSTTDQVGSLINFFPELSWEKFFENTCSLAEGLLILPKPNKIAYDYNHALQKVLDLLTKNHPLFLNCRRGELNHKYLRLTERTKYSLSICENEHSGNLYSIPIQLGMRHLGKSARQAYLSFEDNEFGLGPYEISIFLLTHPEWMSESADLGIDCIGCEYGPYGHGFFKYILFFYFNEVKRFEGRWCGCPDVRFGPATGFCSKNVFSGVET